MAVAVLVLQAFAGQGGSSGGAADHKAPGAHIAGCPHQVANALQPQHGIINEKRQRVDIVR